MRWVACEGGTSLMNRDVNHAREWVAFVSHAFVGHALA